METTSGPCFFSWRPCPDPLNGFFLRGTVFFTPSAMSANSRYRLEETPTSGRNICGVEAGGVRRGATQRSTAKSFVLRVLTFPGMDFPGIDTPGNAGNGSCVCLGFSLLSYDAIHGTRVAFRLLHRRSARVPATSNRLHLRKSKFKKNQSFATRSSPAKRLDQ